MLGVKSTRKPITGKYAEELRATLERMRTGQLNSDDLKRREFQTQPSAHTMIWNQYMEFLLDRHSSAEALKSFECGIKEMD